MAGRRAMRLLASSRRSWWLGSINVRRDQHVHSEALARGFPAHGHRITHAVQLSPRIPPVRIVAEQFERTWCNRRGFGAYLRNRLGSARTPSISLSDACIPFVHGTLCAHHPRRKRPLLPTLRSASSWAECHTVVGRASHPARIALCPVAC